MRACLLVLLALALVVAAAVGIAAWAAGVIHPPVTFLVPSR